ncbi:calcium permeable stress-gated cation channel 1 [Chironomus tepperi]|uniref:calcium permeable stress-gated cation channel 1 n=1 Tax=Chironomus tepperi TaxID=113505 RepID=UPI00391FB149
MSTINSFFGSGNNTVCSQIPNSNKTTIITSIYEGIPQTLILNVIVWIILILLFTLLRQQAWDFHRLGLVNSLSGKRWTQIFYAHGNNSEILNSLSNEMNSNHDPNFDMETNEQAAIRISRQPSVKDTGFFSWIIATWKLRKDQILKHSGPDAVHYLSFQQHLIVVMGIISFVSIVIILPINFQGNLSGDVNSFSHTTIANLDPESKLLWVHTIFAILFVPLVVLVMRRSSGRNAFKVAPTRTIMAVGISKPDCNRQIIQNYLQQLFPDIEIRDIQLAYNVKKLTEVAQEYEKVIEARIYCEQHRGSIKVKPNCFTCNTVEALEFYKAEEQRLCGEVARLRAIALNDALGIAFISVSSTGAAKQVIVHFKPTAVKDWKLSYSPLPSDIFWENLTPNTAKWYLRWIIVNAILFLFLFLFTTPAYLVGILRSMASKNEIIDNLTSQSALVTEFLPTLLLWSFTALMPVIVSFSETWLNHFTRSDYNYVVMTKTFGYLLFMILILPSLGLASASAFIEWSFKGANTNETYRFECVFLPDRGAFFVNYIITMAFIGTSLELMRFPDLIVYIYRLMTSRSEAETPFIRKSIVIEFPFGIHYSWQLLVFTMAVFYSVACPLITPFALLYLIMKNFNDKHNLYFAYGPSHMISQGGGKIHSTAVTMTKFSVVFLLIVLTGISYFRDGNKWSFRTIFTGMSLLLSLTLFGFMSPIKKCTTKPLPIIEDYTLPQPVYIADVFLNNRVMGNSPSHLSYGSSDVTESVTTSSPQRV